MAFLPSNKIKVYPTANRLVEVSGGLVLNTDDLEAAYNSEHQITTSGGSLGLSKKSFIQVLGSGNDAVLQIVIEGYRFEMLLSDAPLASSGDTYAFIKLQAKGSDSTFKELICTDSTNTVLDENSNFKGLEFGSSITSGCIGIKIATDGELLSDAMLNISTTQISNGDNSTKNIAEEFATKTLTATDDVVMTKIKSASLFAKESVTIDATGKLDSANLSVSYSRPADSGNNVSVISGITESSTGKISITDTTLPLASSTGAGLVSTSAQTFAGAKTFTNTISIGSNVSNPTAQIDASSGGIRTSGNITTAGTINANGEISTANSVNAQQALKINSVNIFDLIYPVGSVYVTLDENFNPNNSWLGTWEKIDQGTFLRAVKRTSITDPAPGTTGGYADVASSVSVAGHALTIAEMPSHGHETENSNNQPNVVEYQEYNLGPTSLTIYQYTKTVGYTTTSTTSTANVGSPYGEVIDVPIKEYTADAEYGVPKQGGGEAHTHNLTTTADSNLPPYINVIMWRRTA